MPVEAKPLFRPDVIRRRLEAFDLPPSVDGFRPKLAKWADLFGSGRANRLKEKELLPDFLTDFFQELLGYTGPASGDRYTLSREKHVVVDGKYADAVLGDFHSGPPAADEREPATRGDRVSREKQDPLDASPHTTSDQRFAIVIEGKGPLDPLDRPFAGRARSAVEQGYNYAINLPCDWIVVTAMRETRLYHKGATHQFYERFETERLAEDEALLRRFVFLLGADRVVPLDGRCHLPELLSESEKVGRELTRGFYIQYADMRQDSFHQLCQDNPAVDRHAVLASAQKLLDRVLFCAFSEDRGLLPPETIRKAYEHQDPYHPRPVWDNFRGLFKSINTGNAALGIHAYNGGLFADDLLLDRLAVSDDVCGYFRDLATYDYRPAHQAGGTAAPASGSGGLIDVDILGHIFEQSITDLEKLKNELDGLTEAVGAEKHKSRRKKEGAFYTPSFITRYIVEQALGGVLRERFDRLRRTQQELASGAARAALADPRVYELDKLKKAERAALVEFWQAWQEELGTVRIVDPACGSGAFLVEAFDQLYARYTETNRLLRELTGKPHMSLFDLDKRILENNIYGVDLNEEAIEICRLSLWIKTAERGKALTSLDHTIRVGNSVVADRAVHPRAFDWQAEFPEVFNRGAGGFDVVVGNPPYVRQELLSSIKPYLQTAYQAYHGMADLYVYFYELGLRLLRPGGLLSFIVTNKWMKSGYGEPLRRFFGESAWIESVVDFGHAKQIFEEADVFPSIIVARKPTTAPKPTTARLCTIPREQLRIDDLSRQIAAQGVELPLDQLRADAWQLEPSGVNELLAKLKGNGSPLAEFVNVQPLSGIKTGFNEAFLIDGPTRNALISADANSAEILKPFLRGQDFSRWQADWAGLWMIALKSSENYSWPWSDSNDGAEKIFRRAFPAIHAHLAKFRDQLLNRQDQGRFWWELRSCAYWALFDAPKIMYPEITWRAEWGLDSKGTLCNNTAYFLPTDDLWILAVANSPVSWWYSWRNAMHGKDEALRFIKDYVQTLPIAIPTQEQRIVSGTSIARLIAIAEIEHVTRRTILDWLRVEHEVDKPTLKLQALLDLDSDAFVAEVKKVRGKQKPLSAAALKSLRDEHVATIEPARALAAEALTLERPGQRRLPPDARRDRPPLANRPTPHADSGTVAAKLLLCTLGRDRLPGPSAQSGSFANTWPSSQLKK